MSFYDLPLASDGYTSYRYNGRYGWIMIGASDDQHALKEAERSGVKNASLKNLEVWNDNKKIYEKVKIK